MNVLYVSGYSGQELASRARWDQQIAYIQKPFRPSELAHKVTEMIARSRQHPPA